MNKPEWLTEESIKTLESGYLLKNETVKEMYERVSRSAAKNYPELAGFFFDAMWKNWLCLATPVAANMGTDRGLPISCFGSYASDSVYGIFNSVTETAMLSKLGGGTSKYWGDVRGRGAKIGNGGVSEGIIGWLKVEESALSATSQGGVRRGAGAQYLPVEHPDIEEFIDIRRQTGDLSRRCLSVSFHHGVCISDDFMHRVTDGDEKARNIWKKILKTRLETGEPYILFRDNVNKQAPKIYKDLELDIKASNLCSEIFLHSDKDHTFVCCLSSLNLARYDEWKNYKFSNGMTLPQLGIYFLDGVMEEFIVKSKNIEGLERAYRFAVKSRALGLGALGWHTLLQSKMIPFDSFESMMLNAEVFKLIDSETKKGSMELAVKLGEPEWCKGYGLRNTHRIAVAPTVSNSLISGGVSQGIEPITANIYSQKSAKGTFIRKNPALEKLLINKNKNTFEVWELINKSKGSVRDLNFLSAKEKEVFLTAREINQYAIIKQAAQRQAFIDQGQSLNLFFSVPSTIDDETKNMIAKYIHKVHFMAWEMGIKGLYYLRSESPLVGDKVYREESDCAACEA